MSHPHDIEGFAAQFLHFARTQVGDSEIYRHACEAIAASPEVLALALRSPVEQRLPMLILAAVHDLLLAGTAHPLSRHYPTITPEARGAPLDVPALHRDFVDFCLKNAEKLVPTLEQRSTQTNEVGRVSVLRFALARLREEGIHDVSIAELGASAGLNLALDRYRVTYSTGATWGPVDAPVHVACELRGSVALPDEAFMDLPNIHERRGLDRNPVQIADEHEKRWLLACVWPDQVARFERTRAAIDAARLLSLTVERGTLPEGARLFLGAASPAAHLCIWTTWVLAYLSEEARLELERIVLHLARTRDITWIVAESPDNWGAFGKLAQAQHGIHADRTLLGLRCYRGGKRHDVALAEMHGHGTWMRILPTSARS